MGSPQKSSKQLTEVLFVNHSNLDPEKVRCIEQTNPRGVELTHTTLDNLESISERPYLAIVTYLRREKGITGLDGLIDAVKDYSSFESHSPRGKVEGIVRTICTAVTNEAVRYAHLIIITEPGEHPTYRTEGNVRITYLSWPLDSRKIKETLTKGIEERTHLCVTQDWGIREGDQLFRLIFGIDYLDGKTKVPLLKTLSDYLTRRGGQIGMDIQTRAQYHRYLMTLSTRITTLETDK